jgi:hypothetical protein
MELRGVSGQKGKTATGSDGPASSQFMPEKRSHCLEVRICFFSVTTFPSELIVMMISYLHLR